MIFITVRHPKIRTAGTGLPDKGWEQGTGAVSLGRYIGDIRLDGSDGAQ